MIDVDCVRLNLTHPNIFEHGFFITRLINCLCIRPYVFLVRFWNCCRCQQMPWRYQISGFCCIMEAPCSVATMTSCLSAWLSNHSFLDLNLIFFLNSKADFYARRTFPRKFRIITHNRSSIFAFTWSWWCFFFFLYIYIFFFYYFCCRGVCIGWCF